MATSQRTGGRDESDANPGRTTQTRDRDDLTRLGNTPGGGSSGAAEGSAGGGGVTGGAGGYLSGVPGADEAASPPAEPEVLPSEAAEPVDRTRVVGGSIAHPYGVDPSGGTPG